MDRLHPATSSVQELARATLGDDPVISVLETMREWKKWDNIYNTPFRVLTYNTAFMPQVEIIGKELLYKGPDDADIVAARFIEYSQRCSADVICFQEVWEAPMRDALAHGLSEMYPWRQDGTTSAGPVLGSGLLILSKWPIVAWNKTVYRHAIGEDRFAAKGAVHVRVQPSTWPTDVDIFTTHLQADPISPVPLGAEGGVTDWISAVGFQLTHLASFVASCSSIDRPAFFMGDFNTDASSEEAGYATGPWTLEHLMDVLDPANPPQDVWLTAPGYAQDHDGNHRANPYGITSGPNSFEGPPEGGGNVLSLDDQTRFINPAGQPTGKRLDQCYLLPGFKHSVILAPTMVQTWQWRGYFTNSLASLGTYDVSDHYGVLTTVLAVKTRRAPPAETSASMLLQPHRLHCLTDTDEDDRDEIVAHIRIFDTETGTELAPPMTLPELGSMTPGRYKAFPHSPNKTLALPQRPFGVAVYLVEVGGGEDSFSNESVLVLDPAVLLLTERMPIIVAAPRCTWKGAPKHGEYVTYFRVQVS